MSPLAPRRGPQAWRLLVVTIVVACGDGDTGERIGAARGAALLSTPGALSIVELPETHLPPDVAAPGAVRGGSAAWRAEPDEWQAAPDPPPALRDALGLPEDAGSRRALPLVTLSLSSDVELDHAGRRLTRTRTPGGEPLWRDDERDVVFFLETAGAALLALGAAPTGTVTLTAPGDEGAAGTGSVVPPGEALGVEALLGRLTVGDTSRRGLLVPAHSMLAADLVPLPGEALQLVLAVAERTYRRADDGRIFHTPRRRLPLVFRIEEESDGSRRELGTATVTSSDGFVPLRVELGPGAGARRLQLSVAPTADAAGWAYALWSDLRLVGGTGSTPRRPNVVLVDVDTLRADRLGPQGAAGRTATPQLDAWAERAAVVFTDSVATSNWTLPSTASLLTGLAVHQHGLLAYPRALGDGTPTLAERLSALGYETRAIVEGGYVSRSFGFDRGFDVFTTLPFQRPAWDAALEWIAMRDASEPFFLFLHTYEVHAPWAFDARFEDGAYDGPLAGRDVTHAAVIDPFEAGKRPLDADDRAYVARQYDAAVARMDERVGAFLARLEELVPADERVVVLTSDHGEELFERGLVEHGTSLYDELLAVPLLVSAPGLEPGASATPASGLDVVPTVLELVGAERPAELPGRSLVDPSRPAGPRVSQHADAARAVRLEGWKLVEGAIEAPGRTTPPLELFDLANDPGERTDRAADDPARVAALRAQLAEFLERHPPREEALAAPAVDAETRGALQALGYLGGDGGGA